MAGHYGWRRLGIKYPPSGRWLGGIATTKSSKLHLSERRYAAEMSVFQIGFKQSNCRVLCVCYPILRLICIFVALEDQLVSDR